MRRNPGRATDETLLHLARAIEAGTMGIDILRRIAEMAAHGDPLLMQVTSDRTAVLANVPARALAEIGPRFRETAKGRTGRRTAREHLARATRAIGA